MPDPLLPNQPATPASAAPAGNASATPEPGTQTRAASPRPQGLDPALQSQLDKRDQRFNTRLDEIAQMLAELQAPTAPAATTPTDPAPAAAPPSQPAAPASAAVVEPSTIASPAAPAEKPYTPAELAAYALMDADGVDINDSDPESKLIDWSDPKKAAVTTRAAIAAKRTRTAQAALPISGGQPITNPIANVTDRNQLWEMTKNSW